MWVIVRWVVLGMTLRRPGVRRKRYDMELKLVLFVCGGCHGGTVADWPSIPEK